MLYIALILVMAAQPAPSLPHVKHVDKYVHACAYGILAALLYRPYLRMGWRRPGLMTVVLAAAVGMADEGIQALGRVRTPDLFDLLADLAGALVGTLLISRFMNTGRMRSSRRETR